MSKLTRLHDSLWLDLAEVVSVTTGQEAGTYGRTVTLTTRTGQQHSIVVAGTRGSGSRPARVGDELLATWLHQKLGHRLAGVGPVATTAEESA